MYDIIFFTDETNNIASVPPIGAYKCAHVLRTAGYRCLVVNHFSDFTYDELIKLADLVISDQTKLIAFSTTFLKSVEIVNKEEGKPTPLFSEMPANQIFPQGKTIEQNTINYFKSLNPKLKILVGGTKANPNWNSKLVDYVCIGYSEISIVNLLNHLTYGEALRHSLKNLWGCIIIDDRLAKTYDFVNSDFEWLPEDVVNHTTLPLEVARGCIFQCKFCSFPMNGKQNLDFVKSENNLVYELQKNYEEFGITRYTLVDDTFNDNVEKLKRLHRVIKKLPFQPIFWGYHRLDLLATRPHTINLLYDIGVRSMYFGIETLNPVSAKLIGKGYNSSKQLQTLEYLRKNYDISLHGNFIAGLPEDTEENNLKVFENLINQNIPLHSWGYTPLIILRENSSTFSSDIMRNYKSYGYYEIDNKGIKAEHKQYNIANNEDIVINWKNKYTSYERVIKLTNYITKESMNSDKLHIAGQFAIAIASMNHPSYSFDTVRNTLFKNFNFHNVEVDIRKNFVDTYKNSLFQILESKNKSAVQANLVEASA